MTLSTTANIMQYSGNGVTTVFSFPYLFYADADLKVYIDSDLQASGYTVSGAGIDGGGSVTFSTAPLTGTTITIQRLVDVTQETDFENFDGNPADVTEKQFDLCVMMSQQNADSIFRALKYPATISGITDASLPTPIDGTALVFDGTTGAITTSATYIADAVSNATAAVTGTALLTATSTTSLATTGTGNKTLVIQSGRGYAMGQRLRAASDDGTKINEGRVVSYSGTSLIINVDYVSGSGTHADWNISVIGDRGASGVGTGDMIASNNLSDVASKPTAFNTIKQAATDTNSGVVELATNAETITGTDTVRAVTPAGVKAYVDTNVTSGLGVGQTYKSVTRTGGVTYTNSTGKPIFLTAYIVMSTNNVTSFAQVSIDGGANIEVVRIGGAAVQQTQGCGSIIIPTGSTYVFTYQNLIGGIATIWELR